MEKALAKKRLRAKQTKETLLSPFQQSEAGLWGSGYTKSRCQPRIGRKIPFQFCFNSDFINHNYALNTCKAEIWFTQKASQLFLWALINIWNPKFKSFLGLVQTSEVWSCLWLSQFLLSSVHYRQVFGPCMAAQETLSSHLIFSPFFLDKIWYTSPNKFLHEDLQLFELNNNLYNEVNSVAAFSAGWHWCLKMHFLSVCFSSFFL